MQGTSVCAFVGRDGFGDIPHGFRRASLLCPVPSCSNVAGVRTVNVFVKKVFWILAVFLLTVCFLPAPGSAAKRVALVIGNSTYQTVPALPNPANDARDVAAALERLQFDRARFECADANHGAQHLANQIRRQIVGDRDAFDGLENVR